MHFTFAWTIHQMYYACVHLHMCQCVDAWRRWRQEENWRTMGQPSIIHEFYRKLKTTFYNLSWLKYTDMHTFHICMNYSPAVLRMCTFAHVLACRCMEGWRQEEKRRAMGKPSIIDEFCRKLQTTFYNLSWKPKGNGGMVFMH